MESDVKSSQSYSRVRLQYGNLTARWNAFFFLNRSDKKLTERNLEGEWTNLPCSPISASNFDETVPTATATSMAISLASAPVLSQLLVIESNFKTTEKNLLLEVGNTDERDFTVEIFADPAALQG